VFTTVEVIVSQRVIADSREALISLMAQRYVAYRLPSLAMVEMSVCLGGVDVGVGSLV